MSKPRMQASFPRSPFVLAAVMLLTVGVYWVGLKGPFLLDDQMNLRDLSRWLEGDLGLGTLLFERAGGTFGRPVSMAAFALNTWIGGYAPFPLKLGNLLVHLTCGLATYLFLGRLLRRDPVLATRANTIALATSCLWLLHPLHASTVLYAVQRMAQLSTLFVLIGLWAYVALRERLEQAPSRLASAGLLLGIPAMTAVAFLAKENGILLPLLCGLVEYTYFRQGSRPRAATAFVSLYLALPALVGLLAFAIAPDRLVSYSGRDFGLAERLLTQTRVLCDYLWKIVAPNPPRMGIYTDDFPISTGLLEPASTLLAIMFLVGMTGLAWALRKRIPIFLFGWLLFLAAHSLEAGPIALEIYFEHRNYLPSVGILVSMIGLAFAAFQALERHGIASGRIAAVLLAGGIGVLAGGTHGRALIWQDGALIAESALLEHPTSLRALVAVMSTSIERGNVARANQAIDRIIELPQPRARALGHAYRLLVECERNGTSQPGDLSAFVSGARLPITMFETQPLHQLYLVTQKQSCPPLTDRDFGKAAAALADRSRDAPPLHTDNWLLRYQAAAFLLRSGDAAAAREQALRAWQLDADVPVAMTLVLAQIRTNDLDGAERVLREAVARSEVGNNIEQTKLHWLRAQLDKARSRNTFSGQMPDQGMVSQPSETSKPTDPTPRNHKP